MLSRIMRRASEDEKRETKPRQNARKATTRRLARGLDASARNAVQDRRAAPAAVFRSCAGSAPKRSSGRNSSMR